MNLREDYQQLRTGTVKICENLVLEDYVVQPYAEVSPPKWHLAHTTWFFEQFILVPFLKHEYEPFNPLFNFLFNSYYDSVGTRVPQDRRGTFSRPTVEEVIMYRAHVDRAMMICFERFTSDADFAKRVELGIHHEQQHQELLMMDILAIFANDPSHPRYSRTPTLLEGVSHATPAIEEGIYEIGHRGSGFCFDNELPPHKVYLPSIELSPTLVTNGEYLEFIEAGGYENPRLWLSDGWALIRTRGWSAPLYWQKPDQKLGHWKVMSLEGLTDLKLDLPVSHVSYYEADAFARWRNLSLPTEFEWEVSALNSKRYDPWPLWQWTQSAYLPYPSYRASEDAFGEYNGKFMSGQMVLRGGCQWTPKRHYRFTYRNFYQPEKRWAFTGIRLARRS